MAEETTPPVEAEPTGTQEPDLAAEVEKWKQLSRQNEQKAKSNAAAAKKLEEIEKASQTETERLTARADAAEKAALNSATEALRLSVAFEKGLTPAQAKRLVGSSREDLEADADEVLRDFPAPSNRPRGSVDQGTRGVAAARTPADAFADLIQGKS